MGAGGNKRDGKVLTVNMKRLTRNVTELVQVLISAHRVLICCDK